MDEENFVKRPPAKDTLRMVPLGGLGRIGGNMMAYETANTLFVVDCGVNFPGPQEPGVDWLLPDNRYIVANHKRFVAYVITHGHEDHIGALPYLWKEAPAPIYATAFTLSLLRRKFEEHGLLSDVDLRVFDDNEEIAVGDVRITGLPVTHSIPHALALCIETQGMRVIHTGDFKIDSEPLDGRRTDEKSLRAYGQKGVDLLVSDSTNATRKGSTKSESDVARGLAEAIAEQPNRIAVTTFSSNVFRLRSIIRAAQAVGRKVILAGRSIENYVTSANEVGLFENEMECVVGAKEFEHLEPDQVLMIVAGCQGDSRSALTRMSLGKHRLALDEGDTLLMSSREIPGNELAIAEIIRRFVERGVHIIRPQDAPIHASGHACQEEQAQMIQWCQPKYLAPMHGELIHIQAHAQLGEEQGASTVRLQDGQGIELRKGGNDTVLGLLPPLPVKPRLRHGSVDVTERILNERLQLGNDGFVACVVLVDGRGRYATPQLVSAGVFDPDVQVEVQDWATIAVENALNEVGVYKKSDYNRVYEKVKKTLKSFFKKELGRIPPISVRIARI